MVSGFGYDATVPSGATNVRSSEMNAARGKESSSRRIVVVLPVSVRRRDQEGPIVDGHARRVDERDRLARRSASASTGSTQFV